MDVLSFIINNWLVFIIIAIVLLLGLFGYIVDRHKYDEYRDEIIHEKAASDTLEAQPYISNVATAVPVQENNVNKKN